MSMKRVSSFLFLFLVFLIFIHYFSYCSRSLCYPCTAVKSQSPSSSHGRRGPHCLPLSVCSSTVCRGLRIKDIWSAVVVYLITRPYERSLPISGLSRSTPAPSETSRHSPLSESLSVTATQADLTTHNNDPLPWKAQAEASPCRRVPLLHSHFARN